MDHNKTSTFQQPSSLSNCTDCNILFKNKRDYSVHRISIHHDDLFNEQYNICNDCQISFDSTKSLSVHRINIHHDDLYSGTLTSSCEYCGLTIKMNDINTHTCTSVDSNLFFNPSSEYDCIDCNLSFNAYEKWSVHRVGVHHADLVNDINNMYVQASCKDCNMTFNGEEKLVMHRVNVHHGDLFSRPQNQSSCLFCGSCIDTKTGVTCSKCEKSPVTNIETSFPHKRSILERTFSCGDCNKEFATKRELCVHRINVHHDDLYGEVTTTTCPCEWCGLDYETDDQVISHICDILDGLNENDGVPDDLRAVEVFDSLKCPCCPLQFSRKLHLQRHYLRKHIYPRKFLCSICGFFSKNADSLKNHEAIHLNNRPFSCETCPSKFATLSAFKAHLNIHNPQRLARRCLKCGKTFNSRNGFLRHLLTHQDSAKIICPQDGCDKGFLTSSELKRHLHCHRKQHECIVCLMRFTTWNQLKRHLSIHMGLDRHICHICGAKSKGYERLRVHIWKKHNIKTKTDVNVVL